MATLRELQRLLADALEDIRQRDVLIDSLEQELDEKDALIDALTKELNKYKTAVMTSINAAVIGPVVATSRHHRPAISGEPVNTRKKVNYRDLKRIKKPHS